MEIQYTSQRDVVERIVIPALAQFADDHDVDSIASEIILGWDENGHAIIADEDTFWASVARHAF